MEVNDIEYQCWHELGHAVTCLELGGSVEYVEFIEDHEVGKARARCATNQAIRQRVACGGFAAELMLFRDGDLGPQDEKSMVQLLFRNATIDRTMYHSLDPKSVLTADQDREFMNCAYANVVPIIRRYKNEIAIAVVELKTSKKICGDRIKRIMDGT